MQKFLIIVKFASIDHFCQFYAHLSSGSVFLPSAKPLPGNSRILLQIWIPGVKTSFLVPGKIVPPEDHDPKIAGMAVDVSKGLPQLLPDINQALAATDIYPDRLSLTMVKYAEPVIEADIIPEPETETAELAFQLDKSDLIDTPIPHSSPSAEFKPETSLDDALLNLEMEDAEDYLRKKIDPEVYPESHPVVSLEDDALEFRLQTDEEETQLHQSESQTSTIPLLSAGENENLFGILFDDVKQMVNQAEVEREIDQPVTYVSKKILEKKDLTPEERALAEPVGKFFMNLTKAMLRSGYYDPGHPSSNTAKKGLYDEFVTVLGGCQEIMITHQATREATDMMLTGILDEPVSIRQLVGPGIAELFVPKLSAYCEKKKLLSFAVKREIAPDHFYDFIDIMSDPQVDNQGEGKAGRYLTDILVSRGITKISTIFAGDMLELETNLPWRVEMAIHRLAKDLKVLPMFSGISSDSVKNMKLQAVKDIIRPLKHPQYLNDFLVNCYMIARYVDTMKPEEIEGMIVAAFSADMLLPTVQFTFQELDSLNRLQVEQPENEQIPRRVAGIRRILKIIARRVVVEKVSGARHFLHLLHSNNIIEFDQLPVDVQYFINSEKMADDVQHNFNKYMDALNHLKDPEEALVYLQCFKRVVPVFVQSDHWDMVSRVATALKTACSRPPLNSDRVHAGLKVHRQDGVMDFSASPLFHSLKPSDRPMAFVFMDTSASIIETYDGSDKNQRRVLDHIIEDLGSYGVDILGSMLTNSPDREVRRQSFEFLVNKGIPARNWAIATLEDASHPWFTHRNAMMILGKVSHEEADFACVRKFLDHANPKLREEALIAIVSLRPVDAESLIIKALNDSEPKVRWRATRNLEHFAPVSEAGMRMLMLLLSMPLPKDKDVADNQIIKNTAIISAINAMPSVPEHGMVESQILDTMKSFIGEKKSFWKKVASAAVGNDHETALLKAAIPLLGKVGGDPSKAFLKQAAKSRHDLSDIIKKAMMQIN
jgi:HEAT repeat protein